MLAPIIMNCLDCPFNKLLRHKKKKKAYLMEEAPSKGALLLWGLVTSTFLR